MLLGLLLLALPVPQDPRPTTPPEVEPFLSIDGEEVALDEFVQWLLELDGESRAHEFAEKYWAMDREALRLGVRVEDEEVEREVDRQFLERIAGAFRGRKDEWLAELQRTDRTEDGVRRQRFVETRPLLQARALAARDRVVPETLILREWELRHGKHGRRYELAMMRFQVVVPSRAGMKREEWEAGRKAVMEAARQRALAARAQVVGGEDFGLVASRASDDPDTRDHRGVPTGGFRDEGWTKTFLDELATLDPGEISEPIYGRGGWWIVHVRSVETTPLEEVRRGIEADLLARGPEPFEVGIVQDRVAEAVRVEVLPAMLEKPEDREWPSALEPVLRVDGEPVTRGEYARWLVDTVGEPLAVTFVEDWLLRKRTSELGIVLDEALVAERTRDYIDTLIERGYHGDRDAWVAYLAMSGRNEAAFVRRIARRMRVDLLSEALLLRDRVVRPEDVRARFEGEFGGDGVRREVRVVVCATRNPDLAPGLTREELQAAMTEASGAARRRAEALAERARAGEDFAALARTNSDDARTRDAGGALPGRFHADQWPAEVAKAVEALDPLEITEPLPYGNKWYVFQLATVRRVTFEEVREELERELRTARPTPMELAGLRNELGKNARVERPGSSGR